MLSQTIHHYLDGGKLGDGFSLGVNRMIIHSNNVGAGDELSGIL